MFEKKIKIAMHFKDIKEEITLFGTFGIQINVDTLIVSIAAVAQHLFNVTMYWARGEFRRCSRDVKADKTKTRRPGHSGGDPLVSRPRSFLRNSGNNCKQQAGCVRAMSALGSGKLFSKTNPRPRHTR